jgi:hypothetical protein
LPTHKLLAINYVFALCRLIDAIDTLTESYPIQQTPTCFARDRFGCCIHQPTGNQALVFSPELGDSILLLGSANPSLTLTIPASLSAGQPNITFCVYKDGGNLFVRRESYLAASDKESTVVVSHVAGARLYKGIPVPNLDDPIKMTFSKTRVCCCDTTA